MEKPIDYAKLDWRFRDHAKRYVKRAESDHLLCQDCGGQGGYTEVIIDGQGPWYDCGWCLGCGYVTRWVRGEWLRLKRRSKKEERDGR